MANKASKAMHILAKKKKENCEFHSNAESVALDIELKMNFFFLIQNFKKYELDL